MTVISALACINNLNKTGRRIGLRLLALMLSAASLASNAASITTFSPQGEVALIRQARASFSEAMVPFGDPKLPPPFELRCADALHATGSGRWVDDKTWVYDFASDLPPGARCGVVLKSGLKSVAGSVVQGKTSYDFNTGGPAIVRAYPYAGGTENLIAEDQIFALLLNGAADPASVVKNAWCEISGIGERVPVNLIGGANRDASRDASRDAILKSLKLLPQAARVVTLQCQRPLPAEASVKLVWGRGIMATKGNVPTTVERRLNYKVRPAFTASFTCERENAQADCLPIRPLRIEFSAPVPRAIANQIVLTVNGQRHAAGTADTRDAQSAALVIFKSGTRILATLIDEERDAGKKGKDSEGNAVRAIEFKAPLPEMADISIDVPKNLVDDGNRPLANAALFPLKTRTAGAPPLAKFAASPFGVLELNAEPMLPVTLRHLEPDLSIKTLNPVAPNTNASQGKVSDLVLNDDQAIIEWYGKIKRYHETTLLKTSATAELGVNFPAPVKKPQASKTVRYGQEREAPESDREEDRYVQTRTLSLLNRESSARKLSLPPVVANDPRPLEVVGIPLAQPGYHVVEIESQRLGAALLGKAAPMYVRTSALVTNLGVHFKHGQVNSGVWVTTLDQARPVMNAAIRISDCRGKEVWNGTTDKNGFAMVNQALPTLNYRDCAGDGEESSGREVAYFVSARKADAQGRKDMAFVWSSWNEGIESWRFNLSSSSHYYGGDEDGDEGGVNSAPLLLHTVFDRTLLRAGQTVSMKHYARTQELVGLGLPDAATLPDHVRLTHVGSGQKFEFDLNWRASDKGNKAVRYGETVFNIPQDARLGQYEVELYHEGQRTYSTGTFRVEEFRLPVMAGRIVPPRAALVQPKEIPLNLQVNYGNGGGAAGLPVKVSAQLRPSGGVATSKFHGFRFEPPAQPRDPNAASIFSEQYVDENDDQIMTSRREGNQIVADKLAVTLDKNGAGLVTLTKLPAIKRAQELQVEATYADPNGEIQTLSQTLSVWPSAIVVGIRADSWISVKQKIAMQMIALDTSGKPLAGVSLKLRGVLHNITSVRKRLVGGFYAYDNQNAAKDLGQMCSGTSDARGLVLCEIELNEAGQVELITEAKDSNGNLAQAAASVYVTRQGEIWFGGDNQDRMDVIPERRDYLPGEIAKFQVRMPFRSATALIAIERNGIVETRVVELRGSDPTIELPIKAEWAPNVYVSVLAVRGRITEVPWYSFFTWGWRAPVAWWQAWRGNGADKGKAFELPTAMVDLSKPSFKYGIAEITVGTAGHQLKVEVTPDKTTYPIRATSQVKIKVTLPNGQPVAAGTEVALAAVDEALLELKPNTSWDLLNAMIRQRSYGIETATAQMQIIGKRHYGKKAAPAGGGGGDMPTRELFDTLLLWNPRVVLDAKGEATVSVPLNDSLTAFRIVAIADAVEQGSAPNSAAFFGTGSATIKATQDLQILAGLPPLVREGDQYRALVTLRNTTPKALDVNLTADLKADIAGADIKLPAQKIHIEANAAQEAGWDVTVPFGVKQLTWNIVADGGSAKDRMKVDEQVTEAGPVTTQQATLMQLDKSVSIPISPPVGALAERVGTATAILRGGVEVALKPKLADGLPGVRDYLQRYLWNCLEQKASIAIGLRDAAYWKAIMVQLPLYLDSDGLANYFPPSASSQNTGSDTLTAYLLAASSEAAQLDPAFAIPDEAKARMEAGLVAFVEGRIKRDFWVPAFARNGDLDVRKLAAIEALSRNGKAQARMLQSVQVLPNQWPTSAIIDWLLILQRASGPSFDVPERDKKMAEAEQILRARLNVQGTRLGFSTERDDSWWWLMVNGDTNSTRMILAVLDLPAWKDDLPRIVTGTLQRQQLGHWSTTVANVWGSLAIEKFSNKFEREPVTGSTKAGFDGVAGKALDWAGTPGGGALALGWPQGFGIANSKTPTNVQITQEGSGKPWLTLTSRAAVPLNAPFSSGYRISKTITPVEEKEKGKVSRGDIWRIHIDIDAQADMTWVAVNDPIPAGATILGSGLGRDAAIASSTEQTDWRGWLAYQERSFESFRSYYRYVPKGKFSIEYTVRLNNPGQFGLPQTRVEAMYAPEMFGEFPNAVVKVQ